MQEKPKGAEHEKYINEMLACLSDEGITEITGDYERVEPMVNILNEAGYSSDEIYDAYGCFNMHPYLFHY